jgi:hypothetical protein
LVFWGETRQEARFVRRLKEVGVSFPFRADEPIVLDMGSMRGMAKSTAAQRAEVVRLREAGGSIRSIAAEVFGDARYRGRVERILAGSSRGFPPDGAEGVSLEGLAPVDAIRVLYERRLALLLAGEVAPSMTELQKLLDVQRRLDAFDGLERLRTLTRRPG